MAVMTWREKHILLSGDFRGYPQVLNRFYGNSTFQNFLENIKNYFTELVFFKFRKPH